MFNAFRQLIRIRHVRPPPAVPAGERVYAIGDIHGRLDLFDALRDAIDRDDAASGPASTTVILLGDLIDRGPHSAQVLAAARAWGQCRRVRILAGNHEEMLLRSLDDAQLFQHFLRFGGRETLMSYLPGPDALDDVDDRQAHALLRSAIPAEDIGFVAGFEDRIAIGDYLFVHAGVRPGIALDRQTASDGRWIREPFLGSRRDHGAVVVHGHTIAEEPAVRPNRIGIDTGAYASGRLTALGLQGAERWLIQARESGGELAVSQWPVAND